MLILGIGLLTGILVARVLGPIGRGEVAAITLWASVITHVGDLGLPTAYIYSAAREPGRRLQMLGNALVATPLQWLVIGTFGTLALKFALARHGTDIVNLAVVYLWMYIPLNLTTRYINAVQQGLGNVIAFNAVRLCVPVAYFASLLLFVKFGMIEVESVLGANILSFIVTLLVAFCWALHLFMGARPWHFRWVDFTALARDFRYGLRAHLGTLQPFGILQLDVLILTILLDTHDLGLYLAAVAGGGVLKAQGYAIGMMVLSDVAKEPDPAIQRHIIGKSIRITAVVSGLTAGVAFLWAEPIVRIVYGISFEGAAPILRVTLVGGMVAALYRVIADGLRGLGYPIIGTIAELTSVVVGLPLLMILAPSSALGAAVAVTFSSISAFAVVVVSLLHSGFRFSDVLDRSHR